MIFPIYLKNKRSYVGAVALLALIGCANAPEKGAKSDQARTAFTEEAEGRAVTSAAAKEVRAHNFVEIEFNPGSSVLSESAKTSLNAIMEQARQDGKIDEVIVLSWADQEYPSANVKKLSKPQTELAENRNKAVENYVKTIRRVDVDTYNMAAQPNALSKWFNTTDNKLKKSFLAAGLPTTADSPKYPSKASHSVILVKIE